MYLRPPLVLGGQRVPATVPRLCAVCPGARRTIFGGWIVGIVFAPAFWTGISLSPEGARIHGVHVEKSSSFARGLCGV